MPSAARGKRDDTSELLHLIAQGEGQRLEFKRSLAELEDAVCTIAAFANAEGGTLLFGVQVDYPHLKAEVFL